MTLNQLLFCIASPAFLVATIGACGSAISAKASRSEVQAVKQLKPNGTRPAVQVPAYVQRLIDMDFPNDGQVYVQTRGKFRIRPDTFVCILDPKVDEPMNNVGLFNIGLDWADMQPVLRSLGQVSHFAGLARIQRVSTEQCIRQGNIYTKNVAVVGRNGLPYRFIAAYWQGNTYWISKAEKDVDPENIRTWDPPPMQNMPFLSQSLSHVPRKMSQLFTQHLMK
jgi:hypothetical protein